MSDFSSGNLGELTQENVAGGNIYHITASIDALIELLQANLAHTNNRVSRLEEIEAQHSLERQSLTRAIMILANENTAIKTVQKKLDEQIELETNERNKRRDYVDRILYALIIANAASIIARGVFRGSRRSASVLRG